MAYVVIHAYLSVGWAVWEWWLQLAGWVVVRWDSGWSLALWAYSRGPITEATIDGELRRRQRPAT